MRLGEGERVVVPVGPGARAGDSFRVAVRPERVQIGPVDNPGSDGGSRLEGTIAEIVYLGMYTQFHVDTRAGRVVSATASPTSRSRRSRQARTSLSPGSRSTPPCSGESAPTPEPLTA